MIMSPRATAAAPAAQNDNDQVHHKDNQHYQGRRQQGWRARLLLVLSVCFLSLLRILCSYRPSTFGGLVSSGTARAKNKNLYYKNNSKSLQRNGGDGCGLDDGVEPRWRDYTAEQVRLYRQVQQCYNRIGIDSPGDSLPNPPPKSSLVCNNNANVLLDGSFQKLAARHDRIWFIGDSFMRQVISTFVCILMPNITNYDFIGAAAKNSKDVRILFNHTPSDLIRRSTLIRYSQFGRIWDERPLYLRDFPEALRTSRSNDAIVIDAGLHYAHEGGPTLLKTAKFIADSADKTKGTIYFIETPDEQWPTSNGMWTNACMWFCKCEPLDKNRLMGKGSLIDHSKRNRNISGDLPMHVDSQRNRTLQQFYASHFPQSALKSSNDDEYTVPSYLPASWRNDLVNPILLNYPAGSSNLKVIPIWRQLVARGLPHGRRDGDCTHKSLNALIATNEQLLRAMMATSESRDK